MHHISLSSLVVFGAICLLYALVVLAILQFCKVAKLKPNPPTSSTVRVELTISARAPAGAYPDKSEGTFHHHNIRLRRRVRDDGHRFPRRITTRQAVPIS